MVLDAIVAIESCAPCSTTVKAPTASCRGLRLAADETSPDNSPGGVNGLAERHKPLDSCMIWLLKPDQQKATEFAPTMDEGTGILAGLPSVKGKPVHVAFDGGQMTSDTGILLLAAIKQQIVLIPTMSPGHSEIMSLAVPT